MRGIKRKVNKRLTRVNSIVDLLSKGLSQTQIAKKLKISKAAVSKHIKRLIAKGYVTENPESTKTMKFYTVNRFSLGTTKSDNYDLHNIEVTVPIMSLGSLPEGNINMGNWKYAKMKFKDFTIMVNYGKVPKLKIYPPKVYGDNIEEVLVKCGYKITLIGVMIEKNFNCKLNLDNMSQRRRPHLHARTDPIIKQIDREEIQYSGENIEFNRSGDAHADILGFEGMRKYDQLLNFTPRAMQLLGQVSSDNNRMFNSQLMIAETLHGIKDILKDRTTQQPKESLSNGALDAQIAKIEAMDAWERVKVRIIQNLPDFEMWSNDGKHKEINNLTAGAEIYLIRDQAVNLIKWGEAELCSG